MNLRELIRRGAWELGIEQELADAIGKLEGWNQSPTDRRRRLMQSLGDYDRRKFDIHWALLAVQFFAYHGREDLADAVIGAFSESRYQGRRDRENEEPERTLIHQVRRAGDARRERA